MAQRSEIDLPFRLGAALLATAAGAALGLVLGLLFLYLGWSHSIARPVAGGSVAGALSGALLPVGAMDFVEATVHFFFGFFATSAQAAVDNSTFGLFQGRAERPSWLRWAFTFGALLALALWAASHL